MWVTKKNTLPFNTPTFQCWMCLIQCSTPKLHSKGWEKENHHTQQGQDFLRCRDQLGDGHNPEFHFIGKAVGSKQFRMCGQNISTYHATSEISGQQLRFVRIGSCNTHVPTIVSCICRPGSWTAQHAASWVASQLVRVALVVECSCTSWHSCLWYPPIHNQLMNPATTKLSWSQIDLSGNSNNEPRNRRKESAQLLWHRRRRKSALNVPWAWLLPIHSGRKQSPTLPREDSTTRRNS